MPSCGMFKMLFSRGCKAEGIDNHSLNKTGKLKGGGFKGHTVNGKPTSLLISNFFLFIF